MYEQTRAQGFGAEVRARILVGNYVLSVGHAGQFYHNARKVQRLMAVALNNVFKEVDILLSPVHAAPAFKFGACDQNPLAMDLTDYFTCFVNLTHIPAISVPCGFVHNNQLPTAFQLIGPRLSESLLYKVAHAYEQCTPWHTQYPVL
jgi:aspartyl-tRNA(Asn)/glutamyl-tRNA(Gln) amidotransferase subunit A